MVRSCGNVVSTGLRTAETGVFSQCSIAPLSLAVPHAMNFVGIINYYLQFGLNQNRHDIILGQRNQRRSSFG